MTAILIADNNPKWLGDMSSIVKKSGYGVIQATNPKEAMAVIGRHAADVAVLDLRLKDDLNDYDISGLNVAQDTDRTIPKILVSEFANEQDFAHALRIDIDAYPAIVDFIQKGEIEDKLLLSIEKALKIKETWSSAAQTKISNQLNDDYKTARRDARIHYWISLGISVAFAAIIIFGAFHLHTGGSLPILFTVLGVLVAEITNYLFSLKLEFLYRRVERFHEELLQTDRFGLLLQDSYTIKNEEARELYKVRLFNAAASHWLRCDGSPGKPELEALTVKDLPLPIEDGQAFSDLPVDAMTTVKTKV